MLLVNETAFDVLFIEAIVVHTIMLAIGIAVAVARTDRVGGLTFWRIARLGGSFYIARRRIAQ